MIVESNTRNTFVASNPCEKVSFGIDNEDLPHLIELLRNDIYNDKELAIIREISTNAYDANIQAGKASTPIKVCLPSRFSAQLKIRDFGNGMTFEQLKGVFVKYGKSTKRGSNSEVGCFGIGAKSPFAYTDSFIVASYINGMKYIYNCVLGENNVGDMLQIGESSTTEPNGIEVIINIKAMDIERVRNKALSFYKYWSVIPDIEGFTAEDYKTYFNDETVVFSGTNWSLIKSQDRYTHGVSVALMGNIPYPIVWSSIADINDKIGELATANNLSNWKIESLFKQCKFIFKFNLGEVKMTPSRESLQYIELTNKAIFAKMEVVVKEIKEVLNNKLDTASNRFEAKKMFGELNDAMPVSDLLTGLSLTYKGVPISSSSFELSYYNDRNILTTYRKSHRYSYRRRGYGNSNKLTPYYNETSIQCKSDVLIIELDQEKKCYPRKAVEYFNNKKVNGYDRIYTLSFATPELRAKVFADLHLNDSFIIKYSTISDVVKDTIVRNGKTGPKVNNTNSDRSLRYYVANSDVYTRYNEVSLMPSKDFDMKLGGIYIEIADNNIKNCKTTSVNCIKTIVDELQNYYKESLQVFFINQNLIKSKHMKLGNWVKFDDYVAKCAKEITDSNELIRYKFANQIARVDARFNPIDNFLSYLRNLVHINSDLKLVTDIYSNEFNRLAAALSEYYTIDDNDVVTLRALNNKVLKMYPMLGVFNTAFRYSHGIAAEDRNVMTEYLS